ncbi:helix-turn-helix transcriptional regulator [Mycolicibacterium sp. S2-37]|uniref:helix-turn-helix transcriptional regulator n=1 Tax=Mycolicibacterium sp. S2-37 TaxID=2810297 RepID=UPI0027DA87BC|nr:helix-turn-helix transcriptional regulator [Mycolicibacterium sp. S2-37]
MARDGAPESGNQLGVFLRAQRARINPHDVGLPLVVGRRVAGLRREEVAVLSGVSADYYARLEQGRERTPSAQVVDAICHALRLAPDARAHAFRLARLSPTAAHTGDTVSPELLQTMDAFPYAAAYVTNPAFRVLIANPAADALITPLQQRDPNVLAALFLDPSARDFYVNWNEVSQASVSALRLAEGFTPAHPEVIDLITRLCRDSTTFRGLWHDHAVAGLTATRKTIRHPEVGMLTLSYQTFDVRSAPGQQLTVATAAPGSASADALALLGTLDATRRHERL